MTAVSVPYVDEALGQLAVMLLHYPMDPTPEIHTFLRKETERLDYSVESLPVLQSYVSYMRSRKLSLPKRQAVILRVGAYLGEVIRRHWTGGELHWIDYKIANLLRSDLFPSGLEGHFDVAAVLYQQPDSYLLPLAKVGRLLTSASEPDLMTWAQEAFAALQSVAPAGDSEE